MRDSSRSVLAFACMCLLVIPPGCVKTKQVAVQNPQAAKAGKNAYRSVSPESLSGYIRTVLKISHEKTDATEQALERAQEEREELRELAARVAEEPYNLELQHRLAAAYLEEGLYFQAFQLYREIRLRAPEDAAAPLALARIWHHWEDHVLARVHAQEAVDLDPASREAWDLLGRLHLRNANPWEAITAFETALDLAPDDGVVCSNLGYAYLKAGKWDEARIFLQRALELDASLEEARNNLGIALAYGGDPEGALEEFSASGGAAAAYNNLGVVYMAQRLWKEAHEAFRVALVIDPSHVRARVNLAAAEMYLPPPALVRLPSFRPLPFESRMALAERLAEPRRAAPGGGPAEARLGDRGTGEAASPVPERVEAEPVRTQFGISWPDSAGLPAGTEMGAAGAGIRTAEPGEVRSRLGISWPDSAGVPAGTEMGAAGAEIRTAEPGEVRGRLGISWPDSAGVPAGTEIRAGEPGEVKSRIRISWPESPEVPAGAEIRLPWPQEREREAWPPTQPLSLDTGSYQPGPVAQMVDPRSLSELDTVLEGWSRPVQQVWSWVMPRVLEPPSLPEQRAAGARQPEQPVVGPSFPGLGPGQRPGEQPAAARQPEQTVVAPSFPGLGPGQRPGERPATARQPEQVVAAPSFPGIAPGQRPGERPATARQPEQPAAARQPEQVVVGPSFPGIAPGQRPGERPATARQPEQVVAAPSFPGAAPDQRPGERPAAARQPEQPAAAPSFPGIAPGQRPGERPAAGARQAEQVKDLIPLHVRSLPHATPVALSPLRSFEFEPAQPALASTRTAAVPERQPDSAPPVVQAGPATAGQPSLTQGAQEPPRPLPSPTVATPQPFRSLRPESALPPPVTPEPSREAVLGEGDAPPVVGVPERDRDRRGEPASAEFDPESPLRGERPSEPLPARLSVDPGQPFPLPLMRWDPVFVFHPQGSTAAELAAWGQVTAPSPDADSTGSAGLNWTLLLWLLTGAGLLLALVLARSRR